MQPKTGKKDLHSLSTIWFFPEDPADAASRSLYGTGPEKRIIRIKQTPQHRPWILPMDGDADHTHTLETNVPHSESVVQEYLQLTHTESTREPRPRLGITHRTWSPLPHRPHGSLLALKAKTAANTSPVSP